MFVFDEIKRHDAQSDAAIIRHTIAKISANKSVAAKFSPTKSNELAPESFPNISRSNHAQTPNAAHAHKAAFNARRPDAEPPQIRAAIPRQCNPK